MQVSGTSVSASSPTTIFNGRVNYPSVAYDSNTEKSVVSYYTEDGSPAYGYSVVFQAGATTLTSENYIGISSNGAADGTTAIIDTKGAIADNLSSLTPGQSYFVQTDGTLGTTAADPSVFAGTAVAANKLIVKG